ncbi:hypothetical protein AALO_G00104050 [Alosa alosa]|uniref:Uncharacterized protein n=1 Tax=Alosa alosa TaxID=278164 RepID=A0AAV6GVP5_9TELE|nr:hypothetical protein AALO_G00104050 [Alosa alosa]
MVFPGRPTKRSSTENNYSSDFKEPRAPPAVSPRKMQLSLDAQEPLSLSQSSNASSTDASQDSERSNPELLVSDDGAPVAAHNQAQGRAIAWMCQSICW